MKYSEIVWAKVAGVYGEILGHPFVVEMGEGVLDRGKFEGYLEQDVEYLRDFGRALAIIGGRMRGSGDIVEFIRFAEAAMVAERGVHEYYLNGKGRGRVEKNWACFGYTNYLLATAALESVEVAVGAVLPCLWIYREVGRHISCISRPGNVYGKWIGHYSDREFSDIVDRAIGIADRMYEGASGVEREGMVEAFMVSSRLEYRFWDEAYGGVEERLVCD